ncbi:MAG: hypothetical protein RLP44_07810 [Aggregatilineales bacterium]
MSTLFIALIGAFGLLMGTFQQGDLIRYPVEVEAIEIVAVENGQVSIQVTGTETLSCDMPMQIVQTYDDSTNTLTVEIYEEATAAVACPRMIVRYDEILPLEIPADVTELIVDVNGLVISINLDEYEAISPALPENGFAYPRIDDVSIATVDGQLELTVSGVEFFNCGFDLIETQDVSQIDWLRVELYREIPPNVRCAGEEQPFTLTIPVDPAFNPDPSIPTLVAVTYVVEVNDFIAELVFTADDSGEFTPELIPTTRELFPIENVRVTVNEDKTLTVNIIAQAPDGCEIPFVTRQVQGDVLAIQVYRPALTEVRACPLILITHDIDFTVELPDGMDAGTYEVIVNDVRSEFTIGDGIMDNAPAPGQILAVVETVDVAILESFPPQLTITVTGYHPDGCDYPVQVETTIDGDTITVRIFREVPADVMCPMNIVPFEETYNLGAVDPNTYTLHVNDYTTEVRVD